MKKKDKNENVAPENEAVEIEKKASKPKKAKKEKKPKVVENKGITGEGIDYNVYNLSFQQKYLAAVVGFALGFAACFIYFDNKYVSLLVGAFIATKAAPIYQSKLLNDRKKALRLQFRDLLESLSNSFTVGRTASSAFEAAYYDMVAEHGKDAYITNEVLQICRAYKNQGIDIRDLLNDFSERSGLDDVKTFAGVFDVTVELSGNNPKVIRETRDMISDKIEIELEIQTMVTGQQNQLNTLMIMPFIMSLLTRAFGSTSNSLIVIGIKFVALFMFLFAYWMGKRIVDIKI